MRCPTARRGLTLVELMVTIALMLIIMSIIVALFTAATDGMTIARTDQELASVTRRLETLIRQDLAGATARFTPPLNPNDNLGYFELGENSSSDAQGEDTDDYLAFTAKAPPGQPFVGRIMLRRGLWEPGRPRFVPTTITSEFAEVIYFLRNNNLYRRVLLIVPDRAESIVNSTDRIPVNNPTVYRYAASHNSDGFDLNGDNLPDVSWQGANDLSVRPPSTVGTQQNPPVPNTLGDLTNRHNRAFRPRFTNDFFGPSGPDGVFDDLNGDGVPDFSPTLYPNAFNVVYPGGIRLINVNLTTDFYPAGSRNLDTMAFPYVFPGAYTRGEPTPIANPASIHTGPFVPTPDGGVTINHSPLDLGDNLPTPGPAQYYTWWGFPTWAETRSRSWIAATRRSNHFEFARNPGLQSPGLSWHLTTGGQPELLPRQNQWFSDGLPAASPFTPSDPLALQDDLVATNVRSFDVKVLDPNGAFYGPALSKARYFDLGYANNVAGTAVAEAVTFGHEGRIPPLVSDNRFDHQGRVVFDRLWPIGDNQAGTVRLRRVWDSWSTDYAFAPRRGIDVVNFPGPPTQRPTYPSYPPPYPSPLLGIQIQIRLAAPDGSRPKVLTIRQDFTDKL